MHNKSKNDQLKKLKTLKVLKKLLPFISKYKLNIFLGFTCMICAASANIFAIYTVKMIVDFLLNPKSNLTLILCMIIIIYLIKIIAEYYQNYLIKSIGFALVNELQLAFYKSVKNNLSILQQKNNLQPSLNEIEDFDSKSSNLQPGFEKIEKNLTFSDILARFSNDMQIIRSTFNAILVSFARDSLFIIFLSVFMLYLNFKLACIVLILAGLVLFPIKFIAQKIRFFAHKIHLNNVEYADSLKNLFLKNSSNFYKEDTDKYFNKASVIYHDSIKFDSLIPSILELLSCIIILLLIWSEKVNIETGTSIGSLVAFITAFNSFYRPLKGLLTRNFVIQDCLSSINRVFEIIELKD